MQKFVATDKVLLLFSVTCRRKVGCFYLNLRDGVMEAGGGVGGTDTLRPVCCA